MAGRHAGDGDAGGLDGQNLVDPVIGKNPVKLGADGIQQFHIQLMVQKAIHFQNIARAHLTVAQNPFFHQFHKKAPFLTLNNPVCSPTGNINTYNFTYYAKIRAVLQLFCTNCFCGIWSSRQFDNIL